MSDVSYLTVFHVKRKFAYIVSYIQREIDSTYVRTLAVIAEAKRTAYRKGFIEGVGAVLLVLVLWVLTR